MDYESHATALDRNEVGALLVAAGLGAAAEHALISLLALNGLRVSEATGADIEHLGLERGHRTLVITRKGGKVVTIPLAPRTARAIDLAIGERTERAAVPRRGRAATGPARRRPDRPPGHPPRRDQQAGQPAHAAARVHHRRPRRRSPAARRAGSRLARRPAHHHALRPGPHQPRPPRHLHRRHLHRRSRPVVRGGDWSWPDRPVSGQAMTPGQTAVRAECHTGTVISPSVTGSMRELYGFELEPEVRDWLDSLSDSDYKRVDEVCGLLAEKGSELGGPWSDHLEGSVWELRLRLRDVAARVTYWCTSDGRIVLLTVFRKTRQHEQRQIDRAVRAQKTCERDHRGPATETYERQV